MLSRFIKSGYRNFKTFYIQHISVFFTDAFPDLVSYTRILRLIQGMTVPLCAFLAHRYDKPTGIAFVDATKLQVCHNLRIPRHKVFGKEVKRGKTSTGSFYGFKLHLIINDQGGIISVKVTTGNVDDRISLVAMALPSMSAWHLTRVPLQIWPDFCPFLHCSRSDLPATHFLRHLPD